MLDFLSNGDDESSLVNDDGIAMEGNTTAQINVVLPSDATMASEFPVTVNDCSTTCPLDMGVNHSCMSYKCFRSAFCTGQLQEIQCIKVENASGKKHNLLIYVKQLLRWDLKTSHIHLLCVRNVQVLLY